MRDWRKEVVMDLICRVFSLFDIGRMWRPLSKSRKIQIDIPSDYEIAVPAVHRWSGGRFSRGPTSLTRRSDL